MEKRQRLYKLILEVLESHCVSLSNHNNTTDLVRYSFRTTDDFREDCLEEVSQGQRSPGEERRLRGWTWREAI